VILVRKTMACLSVCALLVALSFAVEAQQPTKIPRIGYLSPGDANGSSASVEPFQ